MECAIPRFGQILMAVVRHNFKYPYTFQRLRSSSPWHFVPFVAVVKNANVGNFLCIDPGMSCRAGPKRTSFSDPRRRRRRRRPRAMDSAARRRHFLSDYELATPTRPPTATADRSACHPHRSAQVRSTWSVARRGGIKFRDIPIIIFRIRCYLPDTCHQEMQFHSAVHLTFFLAPCLCNHQRRQEMMAWPGPHRTFR